MSDPAAAVAPTHSASTPSAPGRRHGVGSGVLLAASGGASVQLGAAFAARLFPAVGPLGTVGLRLFAAGLVLALVIRPWRRRWSRDELGAAAVLGLVFAAMNTSLYLSLDRLPLATVVTLEFLGPLALAIVTAGGWAVRAWALPAAVGVALLGGGLTTHDVLGVALALTAAACWAAYIVVNGRIGRTGTGLAGLTVGTLVAALVVVPVGAVSAGTSLLHPAVLATGLAVGILSSALPYSLDLLALRRLPTAVFGVLTSLNPGMAALAGLLVLRQALPWSSLAGIALVTAASAGVTLTPVLVSRRGASRHQPVARPARARG